MTRTLLLLVLAAGCVPAAAPSLSFEGQTRPTLRATLPVTLTGPLTQADGERWLTLRMTRPDGSDGAPVFGTYRADRDQLTFVPRHPLAPGVAFRAILAWPDGRRVVRELTIPRPDNPAPRVVSITPGGDVLPANTLRFYIRFSRPMQEGQRAFDRIELLDASDQPLPEVWRPQELWSPDGDVLTLFVHPGRLKRGVGPRRTLGPPMIPGQAYTIRVRAALVDVDGKLLAARFERTFRAGPEDRTSPLPQRWTMNRPTPDTHAPLRIDFGEALDPLLAEECITLDVPGTVITDGRIWHFVPTSPWPRGTRTLHVDPDLEDLAGNRPTRRFEERPDAPPRPGVLTRTFELR